MAKKGKALPARRVRPAVDGSLLIRSAESLGRMIGSLQRQLDGAAKTWNGSESDRMNGHRDGRGQTAVTSAKVARARGAGASGAARTAAAKSQLQADRTSKRESKSAAAGKSAGRSRSGSSRTSAKRGRRS